MAVAPAPPAAAGTPTMSTVPPQIVAPWSATGLTSLGLSYGGQGYDPNSQVDNEKGMSVYGGRIMPAADAQAAYEADLATYQQSQSHAAPPVQTGGKPQLRDFMLQALGEDPNVSPGGHIPAAEEAGIEAAAQKNYQQALDAWNQQQREAVQGSGSPPGLGGGRGLLTGGVGPQSAPNAPVNPTMAQTIQQQFSTMNSDQILNLQRRLQAGGFVSAGSYHPGQADPGTVAGFASLLANTNAQVPMDPSATWTTVLQDAVNKSGWTVQANGDMTRTVSKTPSINPLAAQASLNTAIGRNATPAEIQSFMDSYNKNIAGQLNTTETLTKAGVDSTTAPTYAEQGQTVQQAELEAAQQNPDYATYQAATTYWNAMQQALGAQGNVQNNLR